MDPADLAVWWTQQQRMRAEYLPAVRAMLDHEPALQGDGAARLRANVEAFHSVLKQEPSRGEAPLCDLVKLHTYHRAIEQLTAALERSRKRPRAEPEPAAAPAAAPSPDPAVPAPPDPPASSAPTRPTAAVPRGPTARPLVREKTCKPSGGPGTSMPPPAPATSMPPPAPATSMPPPAPAAAGASSLLSAMRDGAGAGSSGGDAASGGGGSQRAADDADGLWGVVRDIMYAYGDALRPRDECVQLLVVQLQKWQERHIQLVTIQREATAERPGGATLCRKRLRHHFPADYEEHELLQKLRRKARTAEEDDEEQGVVAGEAADEDDGGEEQPAEEEDRVAGAMASRHRERRAFQDERTRDMGAEEYDQFAQRRQTASLNSLSFARKVAATHGLLSSAVTRHNGSMVAAYSFFLRLATTQLGAIVEAANRAAHDGRLHPPLQPLHQVHYLQAVREEYTRWKESAG